MSNNTNYFAMEEELNEFQMWQGLRGPYYTPSVSPDGELSWTNNGSLPNPAPVDLTGPAGKSAYEAAREGGYQGTEAEFNEALAEIDTALQPSDVDSQLSGSSENPVQNKVIYNALQNIHIDVDDELSDSSENPVQNKVITQELADQKSAIEDLQDLTDRKAGALIDTASGAIASFVPDSTIPDLLGVTVAVEPVQDLNGYDKPWPGGGGKNKLPNIEVNTAAETITVTGENGEYTVTASSNNGTGTTSNTAFTLPAGTYTLSCGKSFSESLVSVELTKDGSYAPFVSANNQPVTFTLSEDTAIKFGIFVAAGAVTNLVILVMIESGTEASNFLPPENLCPISGWDAVGIEAAGENLLELDNANNPNRGNFTYTTETAEKVRATKTAAGGSFFAQYKLSVKAGETYTFALDSYSVGGVAQQTANIYLYSDRLWGTSVKGNWNVPTGGAQWTATYTGTVVVGVFTTVAANTAIEISGFQCARGTAKPAFKPYAGNQYTITLGQTVYGGSLDVDAGTMTVDRALEVCTWGDFSFKTTLGNYVRGTYNLSNTAVYPATAKTPQISNIVPHFANFASDTPHFYCNGSQAIFFLPVVAPDSTTIQFSYELATPITIQFDPVTISTISGQTNNVWSDAGDVEVEYAVDLNSININKKQDAPSGAGLPWQVLGLDENLNPVWLEQTGGGGSGTTNYNNLTNKPSINGVSLVGNKTASELGLARRSDIPAVPVQSVNGQTGAVVLDIPAKTSDLTNDSDFVNAAGAAAAAPVQSVNGKTGNVTISVPSAASSGTPAMDGTASRGSSSAYARSDHVHPTDTTRAAAAELATYVRPNLLDNWYFVGGGSQQGYGTFPVNQRGQATYTGSGFCIDRFRGDYSTKELSADGITVTRTGNGTWAFLQEVSTTAVLGKTLTFSALIADYSGNTRLQITWFEGSTQRQVYNAITSVGVTSVALSVPSNASNISAIVWIGAENDYVKLAAVKLEVGSTQTLAHQENGAWVLNEVPDYAEQLAKCQAYYIRFTNYTAPGYITTGSTSYRMKITLPVSMARVPKPTISSYVCRVVTGGYSEHTGAYPGSVPTALSIDTNYGTSNFSIQDLLSAASTDLNNAPCMFEIYGLELSAESI